MKLYYHFCNCLGNTHMGNCFRLRAILCLYLCVAGHITVDITKLSPPWLVGSVKEDLQPLTFEALQKKTIYVLRSLRRFILIFIAVVQSTLKYFTLKEFCNILQHTLGSRLGLSFYQIFTVLPVKNFYQFTGKLAW